MLKIEKHTFAGTSLVEAEAFFNAQHNSHFINCVNWPDFSYKPDVSFKIAHTGREIYLQYLVSEKYIRAKYTHDNDSVWTDSCVEFFISPVEDGSYYNFEFNCIGTALLGYGSGKADRERAGIDITSQIQRISSLGSQPVLPGEGDFSWKLTIIIPLSAFYKHRIESLSGLKSKANFYKCGDELKVPHYLSWNPIRVSKPNFHLPEYFGELLFE